MFQLGRFSENEYAFIGAFSENEYASVGVFF